MFDFFRNQGFLGVRGVKLPYAGLDLQGETPQDVKLEPDILHGLNQLYAVDPGGTPRLIRGTKAGALDVAEVGPSINFNECYDVTPTDEFAHVQQLAQPVNMITLLWLGGQVEIDLSYDGNIFVFWGKLESREYVAISGQIKAIQYQRSGFPTSWYASVLKIRSYYVVQTVG